jgi:hypothetical protein
MEYHLPFSYVPEGAFSHIVAYFEGVTDQGGNGGKKMV